MKMKKLVAVGFATSMLLAAGSASAAILKFNATGVFTAGGNLSGTFEYNTTTSTYQNWSITVNPSFLTGVPGGVAPFTYNTISSVIDPNLGTYSYGVTPSTTNVSFVHDYAAPGVEYRELTLKFASSIAAATIGQTILLIRTGGGSSKDVYDDTVGGNTQIAAFSGGSITRVEAPIPGAVWLFGTGIAGLVGFKRRGKAASTALQA